ncbi:MAG TPA: adenylate/guanylate cyclase domain-containing protein [Flavisolibacter sp.]|nr:adenylate/guanylate cyclase domain-containing protein [Flavisolibacter sp.]
MRQLAAILFADMEGYTALMQENEQLARLKRRRLKEVLETEVAVFNGRVLQNYGDGSLSLFPSAIDCVHCAIRIQQQLQAEPRVDVRIGIHSGDVIIDEEAIYGDGVNLASRIESMGISGGILLSDKVYDEIKNQEDIAVRELGFFEFKNIRQPVRVFAIANQGVRVPERSLLKGKTKQTANRLAVLPFVNMSADPENEYFSDGITEELLNALSRVEELKVTSRTSAFAFKGSNNDIRDIAIQLNVDKVLEGSVRKAGNRVRITAQLINAADGYHIWSESYDRNLTDIFEVQDEISGIIANKLRTDLRVSKPVSTARVPSVNVNAYTHYLKGLHFMNKLTPADVRRAIGYFEQAVFVEPGYAQSYAMMACAYSELGSLGQMLPAEAFELVHRYADKALSLDASSAEGYMAKAGAYLYYEWQWDRAFEALQKSIGLNPALIGAYEMLGFYHIMMGQTALAVQTLEEAARLDPLSPIILQALGNAYIFAERFDDAIAQAEKLLEMDPAMRISIELKAWGIGMRGDWAAALPYFEQVHRLTNHPLKGLMGMCFALGMLGRREKALECIAKMEQRQREEPGAVVDADLAACWFSLGDLDKCFYHINRCIDKRVAPVIYFLEYPSFRSIKSDPRYRLIRERVGM